MDSTGRVSSELRFSVLKHLREQEIAHSAPTGAPLDTRQLEAAFSRLARTVEYTRRRQGARLPKRAAPIGADDTPLDCAIR